MALSGADTGRGVRYFYSDPLAAAWMAKHFGMRFPIAHNRGYKRGEYKVMTLAVHGEWKRLGYQRQPNKYFMHDDSLHLLEPQLNDVLLDEFWTDKPHGGVVVVQPAGTIPSAKRCLAEGYHIIQRNGIAFMWPEVEA